MVASGVGGGWVQYDSGRTIGRTGSEDGIVVADDEHPIGSRITLERDTRFAPWAITCGVYGALMHTRFLGDERTARGDSAAMQGEVARLAATDDADWQDFVRRFP